MTETAVQTQKAPMTRLPRLGLMGVGWIGRNRMQALLDENAADIVAICEPDDAMRKSALENAPNALTFSSLNEMSTMD